MLCRTTLPPKLNKGSTNYRSVCLPSWADPPFLLTSRYYLEIVSPLQSLDDSNCCFSRDFPLSVASNAPKHSVSVASACREGLHAIQPTHIQTPIENRNSQQRRVRYWLPKPYNVVNCNVREPLEEVLLVNGRPPRSMLTVCRYTQRFGCLLLLQRPEPYLLVSA